MNQLPLKTRTKIQEFVASHDDCRVVFGEQWRAATVYVIGNSERQTERLLLGRPRTSDAADGLLRRAERMVTSLEMCKETERLRVVLKEIGKHKAGK